MWWQAALSQPEVSPNALLPAQSPLATGDVSPVSGSPSTRSARGLPFSLLNAATAGSPTSRLASGPTTITLSVPRSVSPSRTPPTIPGLAQSQLQGHGALLFASLVGREDRPASASSPSGSSGSATPAAPPPS
eukprot:RCo050175